MSHFTASNDEEKWDVTMKSNLLLADDEIVKQELLALGLSLEKLRTVVKAADLQRALCSPNHPRGFDLITMNAEVARFLRDAFCGEDWQKYEKENQPGIISSSRKMVIVPCNFDRYCADPHSSPTNLKLKGRISEKNAVCNSTPWLFDPELYDDQLPEDEYARWVLGSYYCNDTERLFAELSLPSGFGCGQYTTFKHRIPVLLAAESSDSVNLNQDLAKDSTEEIDISVSRK